MRTRSPFFAVFSSSCAFTFTVRVTIFPYTGWATRRSSATTTVFCILSLTTRPVRSLRLPRFGVVLVLVMSAIRGIPLLLFGQHRLQPRDVLADRAQPQRVLQCLGRAPESQPEALFFELRDARLDLVDGQLANLLCSDHFVSPFSSPAPSCWRSSRTTNFVRMGIFAAASAIAFCAMSFGMPSSSNITRPGFPTATQPSGEPLPFARRVSAGFLVIGVSGKIRIQTLPPRVM